MEKSHSIPLKSMICGGSPISGNLQICFHRSSLMLGLLALMTFWKKLSIWHTICRYTRPLFGWLPFGSPRATRIGNRYEPLTFGSTIICGVYKHNKLVGGWATPLKNLSQLGWLFPIYGKIKNVPNHQPANNMNIFSIIQARVPKGGGPRVPGLTRKGNSPTHGFTVSRFREGW